MKTDSTLEPTVAGPAPSATPVVGRAPTSALSSSYASLFPQVYREACRRLAGIAFIYAGTYSVIHLAMFFLSHKAYPDHVGSHAFWHILAATSVAGAVAVAWVSRSGRIPPRGFPWVTAGFQILGTMGIIAGLLRWPDITQLLLGVVAGELDIPVNTLMAALGRTQIDVVGFPAIAWSWVWLLIPPLIIPLPTRAAVIGTFGSAATVIGVLLLAREITDVIPELREASSTYIGMVSVSTFIVSCMAITGSRIIYSLTRSLSDARRMGSYRLVEKIGEGGMGEVWRAEHKMLARPAAVKLIRAGSLGNAESSRTALQRFEREAQVIATLTSPHTVDLYDYGVTDDGQFFYVMELLDGVDLGTLVERFGPQSAGRVRALLLQACHSLADAHRRGVLHRDIKPGNLFTCRRGADVDIVKVLDFGLVKEIGTRSQDMNLTADGITTGTPAFLPPEMATGAPVDARTDLYALGCVGFWLLTGRLVFEGDTALAIVAKHVSEPAPAPSACTELAIPEALDRILLDCLEKDPARRPASAQALADRLRDELAEGDWSEDSAEHWWNTHFPEAS